MEEPATHSRYWGKTGAMLIKLYHLLQKKKVQRILAVIQYALIAAIFVYLIRLAGKVDFSGLKYAFIALSAVSVALLRINSIYRLHILLKSLSIPFRNLWKIQSWALLAGLFTPGKAGESIIVWSLGKGKDEKIKIASLFTVSKLFDGIVYVPFGLIFAWLYPGYLKYVLILLSLFVVLLLAYAKINKILKIESKELKNPFIYILTIVSIFLQVVGLYLVLLSKGVEISFLNTSLIWSIASIVALLSTLPGGIGAREAGISYLLNQFAGVDFSAAVSVSLLHGFVLYSTTFLFAMISKIMIKENASAMAKM